MTAHLVLYVADQRASATFYAAALGRPPRLDAPGMTEFDLPGGAVLGLMPEAGIRRLLGDALPDPARARELSPSGPRDWGHRAAYSLDPDGHVLAFAEVPRDEPA